MADFLDVLSRSIRSQDEQYGRVYGFVYGTITDVEDPKGLQRVRARIGAQDTTQSSDWLLPLLPGSIESKPRVGEKVVVAFVDGDPNRGVYAWHPQSTTNDRPSEVMILGNTFAALFNRVVELVNEIKADFNGHTHDGVSGSPGTPNTNVDTANAGAILDHQGAQVTASGGNKIALSGEAKVR